MENTQNNTIPTGIANKIPKLGVGLLILAVLLVVAFWFVGVRNNLATLEQGVKSKQSTVETDLNRRFDLVPNLVETVKGVAKQEQEVFGKIADARSRYAGASTSETKDAAMNDYQSALGRLLVITENYPELRSSESFQNLMAQLEGTENRIAVARKDANTAIEIYNKNLVTFPTNMIAKLFGYSEKAYFKAPEAAQSAPQVKF